MSDTEGRIIAIGDIHGCLKALTKLIEVVDPKPHDTVVTLGDYVNRGEDSRGVLDFLGELGKRTELIMLLGNHDDLLVRNRDTRESVNGETVDEHTGLDSYSPEHFALLSKCRLFYETDEHFFVHGMYDAKVNLDSQKPVTLLWNGLKNMAPSPHVSGKIAVVGHSPQRSGEILDLGFFKCIDTNCWNGGWLTALDVKAGTTWQVNREGIVRG